MTDEQIHVTNIFYLGNYEHYVQVYFRMGKFQIVD